MAEPEYHETQFTAKDFTSVDDIMSIIDAENGSTGDKSAEAEQSTSPSTETTQQEPGEESPQEQSSSSQETVSETPDAETSLDAQSSQSNEESEKGIEAEVTDKSLDSIDLSEDEELVIELESGEEIPIDQIVQDWQNNQDWQKANTEKAQQLAEQRKSFEDMQSPQIAEALKNDDLMEALDDWFEGGEKNPFREAKLNEQDSNSESTEVEGGEETLAPTEVDQERSILEIEKEVFELQKMDESLKDEANLQGLARFALDNDLTLTTAHKLMQYDYLANDVDSLRNELKERNTELSSLRKSGTDSLPATVTGKGSATEEFQGSAGDWKGAEQRILQKLGLN